MQITIRDAQHKPEWLAKVGAFLHDAPLQDDGHYDESTQTFRLSLQRVGWEFRVRRTLLLLTIWRMPFVPAVLTVAPVVVLRPLERDHEWNPGDQLKALGMATPSELHLVTDPGTIVLGCVEPATLTVTDSGPPGTRLAVTDIGRIIISPALVDEIVNTSLA